MTHIILPKRNHLSISRLLNLIVWHGKTVVLVQVFAEQSADCLVLEKALWHLGWHNNLGAIHIRSDTVCKHITGIALDQHGNESLYSFEKTKKTY